MNFTYIASSNITADSTDFGAAGKDVFVKKLLLGSPADGKVVKLYNKNTAYGHASAIASTDSSDVAFYFTQTTHAAGCDWVREVDFTGNGSPGLQLDGGSIHTDGSHVTVVWEYADEG